MPEPTRSKLYRLTELQKRIATGRFSLEVLDEAVDQAIELTKAERGFIVAPVERGPDAALKVRAARDPRKKPATLGDKAVSFTLVDEVLETNQPLLVDPMNDKRFSKSRSLASLAVRSVIVVPLEVHGTTVGALVLHEKTRTPRFSEEDVRLAELVALPAALALETFLVDATVAEQRAKKPQTTRYKRFVGSAPCMEKLYDELEEIGRSSNPVLIHGESGTGKESVASAIHELSPRAKGPYLVETMTTIPEPLAESILFGHEKGSFTGATEATLGLFRSANGGTVFLDEVGDMSPTLQAKLLRVLQEGEVMPVGSSKAIKVDVRVIVATHRNLEEMVQHGKFRQDLYYRLAVLTITTPPLRERKSDIPALAAFFLAAGAKKEGVRTPVLSPEALAVLMAHDWPGNVRELANSMFQACAKRHNQKIPQSEPVRPDHFKLRAASAEIPVPLRAFKSVTREEALDALRRANNNRSEAARLLNVTRQTLYNKLKQLGIT